MLTPERLLRVMIELIFVLLGGLVAWLALRVLILWGLRVLYKPGQWRAHGESWTRGLSLALLGALMLAITRVPFAWVEPMLAAGGAILVARGIVASTLLLRPR